MRTRFREEETLEGWNRRRGETCVTEKNWAEKSSELRDTSLRRSKCTQAKQRASLVFPPNSNLQELNSWFLFTWGFLFVLLLCLGKDYKKYSGSGETFMSAGKTKPRPPWWCFPQLPPTTEQAPSLVSRNPSQNQNCLANFAKWNLT